MPEVNNRPQGKNSPNLVTLIWRYYVLEANRRLLLFVIASTDIFFNFL
jgi:hypothetical protein